MTLGREDLSKDPSGEPVILWVLLRARATVLRPHSTSPSSDDLYYWWWSYRKTSARVVDYLLIFLTRIYILLSQLDLDPRVRASNVYFACSTASKYRYFLYICTVCMLNIYSYEVYVVMMYVWYPFILLQKNCSTLIRSTYVSIVSFTKSSSSQFQWWIIMGYYDEIVALTVYSNNSVPSSIYLLCIHLLSIAGLWGTQGPSIHCSHANNECIQSYSLKKTAPLALFVWLVG